MRLVTGLRNSYTYVVFVGKYYTTFKFTDDLKCIEQPFDLSISVKVHKE